MYSLRLFGLVVGSVFLSQGQACAPATLEPGETWEYKANCYGVKYNATHNCHCWGHCGYICTKVTPPPPNPPPPPPACQPGFENGPNPLPPGSKWLSAPGCTYGGRPGAVLTSPTVGRCRCYGFCGYICQPPPT